MGLRMSCLFSAARTAEPKTEHDEIVEYALDSKLSMKEVLFQDARCSRNWKRKDFIELVGTSGVPTSMSDLCFDRINKSSLMADDGHLKKFIFRTTFAGLVSGEADSGKKADDYLVELCDQHLSSISYLAERKIDATKCDLWCIPVSYDGHATAIVINIKEACFEYLDSGSHSKRRAFKEMGGVPKRISKLVTTYINSMLLRQGGGDGGTTIDFGRFKWRYPPVPCQPRGSNACAVYRLRFLEEWNGGADLRRFEGWDEDSWHVKERVKMCASILTDQDSNAVLGKVRRRARRRRQRIRSQKQQGDRFFFAALFCLGFVSVFAVRRQTTFRNPFDFK